MILDKESLQKARTAGLVTVDCDVGLEPNGIRLHLVDLYQLDVSEEGVVDLASFGADMLEARRFTESPLDLPANGFVLSDTIEAVSMDDAFCGIVDGKSSFARLGLSIHCSSMLIDKMNGAPKRITLEIKNNGTHTLRLRKGMHIGNLLIVTTGGGEFDMIG